MMPPERQLTELSATAEAPPVVFVVDDDKAVRDSVQWLLGSVAIEVRTCASAAEFVAAYRPGRPACLITDVRMPGMSGLDLQAALADRAVELPVIIVTGHGDVAMAVKAMKAGAFDFVEKPCRDQALLDVVQKALESSAAAVRAGAESAAVRARLDLLTPRERQVLEMVVAGESNKGIAHRLGISEKTVEAHRANVMEKMQARSFAELMRLALRLDERKAAAPSTQKAQS